MSHDNPAACASDLVRKLVGVIEELTYSDASGRFIAIREGVDVSGDVDPTLGAARAYLARLPLAVRNTARPLRMTPAEWAAQSRPYPPRAPERPGDSPVYNREAFALGAQVLANDRLRAVLVERLMAGEITLPERDYFPKTWMMD